MAQKIFSFRLDEDLVSRIDALDQRRSDFVREAILAALDGRAAGLLAETDREVVLANADQVRLIKKPVSEKAVRRKKNFDRKPIEKDGLRPDEAVLLEAVRRKRMTSQQADRAMGWLGLRFARAESELLSRGLIRVDGGVLVAVDGASDDLE